MIVYNFSPSAGSVPKLATLHWIAMQSLVRSTLVSSANNSKNISSQISKFLVSYPAQIEILDNRNIRVTLSRESHWNSRLRFREVEASFRRQVSDIVVLIVKNRNGVDNVVDDSGCTLIQRFCSTELPTAH